MRFRQQQTSSNPEVNLVPMIDVMMSVLIFFIITSMSLTIQNLDNVNLPNAILQNQSKQMNKNPPTLIIGLDKDGKILIDNQPLTESQLIERIESFLSQEASGQIIIKADKELSYQEVSQVLKKIGKVSSSEIFLAIDQKK